MTNVTDAVEKSFETNREHLRGVAYRMLGSLAEADDAVQEAWLRLSRADTNDVENPKAWLTTVVARVCLDMLRSRKSRAEDAVAEPPESGTVASAEQEAVLADSVGLALLVVLDMLDPAERLAFVLHDLFGVSFEEIATIVGRSTDAARQLASRARRRIRGAPIADDAELAKNRAVVDAFLAALRSADFDALVAVLDPDVVVEGGGTGPVRGAEKWARSAIVFAKGAKAIRAALVDGAPAAILAPRGHLVSVVRFTFANEKITRAEILTDRAKIAELEIALLDD